MQNKFSNKAKEKIQKTQEGGKRSKNNTKREAKDFNACYEAAQHRAKEGWNGMPASCFRLALISACRVAEFKMTIAKLSVFVEADGYDGEDGTPLVKITKGKPSMKIMPVRNDSGVIDLRARPVWEPGWQMDVRIKFDADQFDLEAITNLLMRAGIQVGIGEGRPDSRDSAGIGFGTFDVQKA